MSRVVLIILDGVGAGALPDASAYADAEADTLGNVGRVAPLHLPNLQALGLGCVEVIPGVAPVPRPHGLTGRLRPRSAGKDTTVGHWEHMGVVTSRCFPTYPHGFPAELIKLFVERTGHDVLGNVPASGTQIIEEFGARHMATGDPIVYTSADSVFQIACHVDVCPLSRLYHYCQIAREILSGRHAVARVIARPFTGTPGAFVRTKDRRDFSLSPPRPTYLDLLVADGVPVLGMGKISEIFAGRGVTDVQKVSSNADNLRKLLAAIKEVPSGLIFTNLVDFDMVWGHRNDVVGFARGLEAVDERLPDMISLLKPDDHLLITADHGVDPTTSSTDHSREYVPLLYLPAPPNTPRATYQGEFSDVGATIYNLLTAKEPPLGGAVIERLRPLWGWRRFTRLTPSGTAPQRVGATEAGDAAAWLRERLGPAPDAAVVLGSGLHDAWSGRPVRASLSFSEVPHWHMPTVIGHPGSIGVVEAGQRTIAVLQGRLHLYEGFDQSEIELPVASLARWGVDRLIVTNACGLVAAARSDLGVGTLALITALLDFQTAGAGRPPERYVGTHPDVVRGVERSGLLSGICRPAVYAAVTGPQYETPQEVGVLAGLGADVVGMSTLNEVMAASRHGLGVAVVGMVVNPAGTHGSHQQVLQASRVAVARLEMVVETILDSWPERPTGRSE